MQFTRMGHVALNVSDIDRAEKFYVDLLGMTAGWKSPQGELLFLRCGGDDLALIKSKRPGNVPEGWSPLNHIGFRVATREDVDKSADEIRAKVIDILDGPRDHRDGSRSFYFRDPDGNMIQILWDPTI